MRKIVCPDDKSTPIAENITGEYRLKDTSPDLLFFGRQMPNGRLFVPYVGFVEMYEPGEYKLVYHYPRTEEEDHNDA